MSSASLSKILEDAKWLLGKVQLQESAVNGLASQAADLKGAIKENMKESDSLPGAEDPSKTVSPPSPAKLHAGESFSSESAEKQRIRQLEKENADLRTALNEHEYVLELIMTKYRQQVLSLEAVHQRQLNREPNFTQIEERCRLQSQAVGMAQVMARAAYEDDDQAMIEQEVLAQLQFENQSLRELVQFGHPAYNERQLEALIQNWVQNVKQERKS